MRRNSVFMLCMLLIVFAVLPGCSKKSSPTDAGNDNGLTGDITTGKKETIASQTVGSGGGTITVEKTGDPLDGLEITVPQGALSESNTITVTEASIENQKLGENFNPISPVITVKNVPVYADDAITVKVPVTVPEGHVAIGALYNEKTGEYECVPLVEQTATSVTIATQTFNPWASASAKKSGLFKTISTHDALSMGNLLILSLDESKLKGAAIINTGFTPGVDDWEFVNRGSYIAPRGICAGQSVSAMWYYYEKKLNGAPSVYHQFDKVLKSPKEYFEDNTRGYRFASMVQTDMNWDVLIKKLFLTMSKNPQWHSLGWKCFAFSMFLTGEPQLVCLQGSTGGHAIVAYKMDYTNGILYVADPNYPGQERTIKFNGAQFEPYNTKQNADEVDENPYTGIGYFAKSSFFDWDKIGSRWSELENLTIGNDRFPKYRLWLFDGGAGQKLESSYSSFADSIVVQVQWENGTIDGRIMMAVFDVMGNQIVPDPSKFKTTSVAKSIKLTPGENILGFQIWGKVDINDTTTTSEWLDFQWIPVNYTRVTLDPASFSGKKNTAYTFTAKMEGGAAPASAKYLWNFGDNTAEVSNLNSVTASHSFAADGAYTVTLKIYDTKTDKLLTTATSRVSITTAEPTLTGDLSYTNANGFTSTGSWVLSGTYLKSWYSDAPLTAPNLSAAKDKPAVLTITATTPQALETIRNDYTPADSAYSITTIRRKLVAASDAACLSLPTGATFPITTSSTGNNLTVQFTFNGKDDYFYFNVFFEVRQDVVEYSLHAADKGAVQYSYTDKFISRYNTAKIYVKQFSL